MLQDCKCEDKCGFDQISVALLTAHLKLGLDFKPGAMPQHINTLLKIGSRCVAVADIRDKSGSDAGPLSSPSSLFV